MQSTNLPSVSLTSSFVLFSYLRPGFGLPIVPLFKASRKKFLQTDAYSVLSKSLVLHLVASIPLKSTSTTSIHVNLRLPVTSLSPRIQMPVTSHSNLLILIKVKNLEVFLSSVF